jgi:hypothetical protein
LTKQRLGGRLTVSEPQAAQYLYAERLVKMTGRPRHDWHRVVVKELVDNALDAAEMAGVAPEEKSLLCISLTQTLSPCRSTNN